MKAILALFVCLCSIAAGASSVTFGSTAGAAVDTPALSSFSIEFRIRGVASDASTVILFSSNGGGAIFYAYKSADARYITFISGVDNKSCSVDLQGITDATVLFARNVPAARLDCFVTSIDGAISLHTSVTITDLTTYHSTDWFSNAGTYSFSYLALSLTAKTAQTCAANIAGDYLWLFDGNLTAASGGINFTGGTPSYSTDPNSGPTLPASIILATIPRTTRATALNASSSCPVTTAGAVTYAWSKIAETVYALDAGTFTFAPSGSVAAPSLTVSANGYYALQLVATDAGGHSTTRVAKFGVVTTDSHGGIITGNARYDKILGPMTIYGSGVESVTNPWPWFDDRQLDMATKIIAAAGKYWPRYWQVETEPGTTITITSGTGASVVGTGTHFAADYCVGGTAPCSGASMLAGQSLIIWYNSEDYPGLYGHYQVGVDSVTDDTHLTIHQPFNRYWSHSCPGAGSSYCNVKWTAVSGSNNDYNYYWQSGNHFNYYDNVLSFYALYFRTGNPLYLQWARDLADWFFEMPRMDRGMELAEWGANRWSNGFFEGRDWALEGIILRALDGKPEYWTGIVSMIDYLAQTNSYQALCVSNCMPDHREGGYLMARMALTSLYAPAGVKVPHPAIWTNPAKDAATYATEWLQAEGTYFTAAPKTNGIAFALTAAYGSIGSSGNGYGSSVSVTAGSPVITRYGATATNFAYMQITDPFAQGVSNSASLATSGASATATVSGWTVSAGDVNLIYTLSSGTGFLPGAYKINAVNTGANTWTLDRICSTGTASGSSGALGRPVNLWITNTTAPATNADGDSTTYMWYQRRWNTSSGLTQIVVSGGTATATLPVGHAILNSGQIVITGSATSALNGAVVTTSATATTITWASGAPNGSYTDATIVDNDSATLDRNYAGLSGNGKGWLGAITPGYGTQPYMLGISIQGYALASDALTAALDPTGAAKWSVLANAAADWLMLYGIRPAPNSGGWVQRGSVGCENYISTGIDFPVGVKYACTAGDDPENSRVLLGEMQGGLARAYTLNPTPSRAAQIDGVFSSLWSKPGTSAAFPGDGYYLSSMDGGYMIDLGGDGYLRDFGDAKWWGFFFGKGGGYIWPAARLGIAAVSVAPGIHGSVLRAVLIR